MEKYDIKNEPTILSKALLDLFLQHDNPDELIALYVFYYYTAKWQGTNYPKAVNNYAMKGLRWGETRLLKNKKILLRLGLIENKRTVDNYGRVLGHYVKVNFVFSNHDIIALQKSRTSIAQTLDFEGSNTIEEYNKEKELNYIVRPTRGRTNNAVKRTRTNFGSDGNDEKFQSFAERIFDIVRKKKNIIINSSKLKQSVDPIRKLFKLDLAGTDKEKFSQMRKALEYLEENMYKDQYCPVVESGAAFREKFQKVLNAIERNKQPKIVKGRVMVKNDDYFKDLM